jgi:hypothetical protein
VQSFEELSDYDFERLAADLLAADWGVRVHTFPRDRDGGVDLRVLGPITGPLQLSPAEELVAQCIHRPNARLPGLRAGLVAEAAKPIVDEATRYVLVTSARLTRQQEDHRQDLWRPSRGIGSPGTQRCRRSTPTSSRSQPGEHQTVADQRRRPTDVAPVATHHREATTQRHLSPAGEPSRAGCRQSWVARLGAFGPGRARPGPCYGFSRAAANRLRTLLDHRRRLTLH